MDGKGLDERRKALEDAFFRKENERLVQRLRDKVSRKELSDASGISDDTVLADLEKLGVDAASVSALSLVPLVWVAWADRDMQDSEQAAILQAAEQNGITTGSAAHDVLKSWLNERPPMALFESWKHYAQSSCEGMDARARARVRDDVVSRARAVADAAGGILGIATISQSENDTLDQIFRVFG